MAQSAAIRDEDPVPRDREAFFVAAYDLLAEHGSAGVTVAALCDRVGVTKGSFYHHFADMPEFVAAFALRWQAWVEHIIDNYLAEPDPLRRFELAANSHVVLVTGAEPAIWAWARTEPSLAAAVQVVLARGNELGEKMYGPVTGDARVSNTLTRMVISAMLGMQQRAHPIHRDRFVEVVAEWGRRCLHVDVEVIRVGGRTVARARGLLPEPIPPHRPVEFPEARLFDAAIAAAVAELSPGNGRGREAYFRVARELLAEQGPDAVTVASMCERLGVTKGSFHHHFATVPVFVAALTEHWEQKFGALIDNYGTESDPLRRLELMFRTSLMLPHPTEAAWHAWGRINPIVSAALGRQHQRAQDVLTEVLTELLGDPVAADLMAEFGVGLAIGLVFQAPDDAEEYVVAFIEWVRRCLRLEADLVEADGVLAVALRRPA